MSKKIIFVILLSILLYGCAGTTETYNEINSLPGLTSKIRESFNAPLFKHAHWGVLIKSLKTGETWYEQNSPKMFMPASNEKIPTTAAALIKLGEDFRFKTDFCYKGVVIDSILHGDIIVIGDGDPTLYTRFFEDPCYVFRTWAGDLKRHGIKKIEGNIIGDDNAFDDNRIGYGWSHDGLGSWSAAEVGALQFNENYIDIKIFPPETVNDSIIIQPNVQSKYFNIINNLTVVDSNAKFNYTRPFGTNTIYLNGSVKAGDKSFEFTPSLMNPTLFYVTVVKEVLEQEGIIVEGNAVDCDEIPDWNLDHDRLTIVTSTLSPRLKEILSGLMKRSQNMYAETMVRVLGLKESGVGSFREGKKIVTEVLKDFGIDPGTYAYMDGSGLSRYNFISPEQIVKILEGMYNSKYKDTWVSLLPIAGVDGTLSSRMKLTKAEGNVKAKTGTISNVRALSGYVTTDDGEELVFSFLVNGHLLSSKDTEDVTDGVLKIISEFSRKNNKVDTFSSN